MDIAGIDPLIIVPILGGFIGMAVGLVTIWSQFKSSKNKQQADIEASNREHENRLKEFFDLKFTIFDVKMDNLQKDIKQQDETYTRKLEDRSRFFMDLLQKLETKLTGDSNNK